MLNNNRGINSFHRLHGGGKGSGSSPGFVWLLCLSVVIQKPVSLLIYCTVWAESWWTVILTYDELKTSFSTVSRFRGFPEEPLGFLHIKALDLDEDLYEVICYIGAIQYCNCIASISFDCLIQPKLTRLVFWLILEGLWPICSIWCWDSI